MRKTLNLTNDIDQVPLLAEWIEGIGDEAQLPPDKVFQINLAMEEAVVNVMTYAYPEQTDRPIIVSFDDTTGTYQFIIDDEGIAFDPTQVEEPDITLSAEERPIGGLGIMLVRQFASDICYQRTTDGHNRLTISF